ncbi:MAG: ChbG/HpnK family deacetylase [Planctomycetes bacterium]|nr:ChbG/HpnK family deacetylase [Planctomycetota bacterium]
MKSATKDVRARLVFHADDFGLNGAVDQGILDSFRHGLLTSASILANGPTAALNVPKLRALADSGMPSAGVAGEMRTTLSDTREPFDIGVHLNLTQGKPVTGAKFPAELLDEQGCFPGIGALFLRLWGTGDRYRRPISAELTAQIETVVGLGIQPSHVNGHQYIELIPAVSDALPGVLERFGISIVRLPLERRALAAILCSRGLPAWLLAQVKRHYARGFAKRVRRQGWRHADSYFGTAHAGQITLPVLQTWLDEPAREQLIEIGIHPGAAASSAEPADHPWHDALADDRPREQQLLCSVRVADYLARQQLALGRLRSSAKAA